MVLKIVHNAGGNASGMRNGTILSETKMSWATMVSRTVSRCFLNGILKWGQYLNFFDPKRCK